MAAYAPKQGDFIALTFDPQSGHEQRGRRSAFVVSKNLFNRRRGLAIVCPVNQYGSKLPLSYTHSKR